MSDTSLPSDRSAILEAAGVELPAAERRPPSVMYAQALALRATFESTAKIIGIARRPDVDPNALRFLLEAIGVAIEAGVVQCDSFLVMAEAMSAMLPGARPAAPFTTQQPKVFGRGKTDERTDAGPNGGA